jgi:CheY-like chemotaxis protein
LTNPTVLVVDDESVTRRVVTYTLKPLGIATMDAMNATVALELAQANRFDLMLIDINLPGMDGFTLIEKLKSLPGQQNVPLIMFTARNYPGDEARARALGVREFLYKPFSTQELRMMVKRHLNLM